MLISKMVLLGYWALHSIMLVYNNREQLDKQTRQMEMSMSSSISRLKKLGLRFRIYLCLLPSQKQLLSLIGSTALYIFLFIALYRPLGPMVTAFAMLPVASAGSQFGLRAGLLAALLAFPANALLLILVEHVPAEMITHPGTILGHLLLISYIRRRYDWAAA